MFSGFIKIFPNQSKGVKMDNRKVYVINNAFVVLANTAKDAEKKFLKWYYEDGGNEIYVCAKNVTVTPVDAENCLLNVINTFDKIAVHYETMVKYLPNTLYRVVDVDIRFDYVDNCSVSKYVHFMPQTEDIYCFECRIDVFMDDDDEDLYDDEKDEKNVKPAGLRLVQDDEFSDDEEDEEEDEEEVLPDVSMIGISEAFDPKTMTFNAEKIIEEIESMNLD